MKFLKTQTLNRKMIYDNRVALDVNNNLTLATSTTMILPKSTTASPTGLIQGMMRYNTTSNEVEVYQGSSGSWRAIRYKESTGITQQNLSLGNGLNTLFGPLNPAPPTTVQTGTGGTNVAWGPQNLLVIVENVLQVGTTNYLIAQNPVIETTVTTLANTGATSLILSSVVDINVGDTLSTAAPTTTVSTTVNTTAITATYLTGGVSTTTMTVNALSAVGLVAGQKIVNTTGFNKNQYISAVSGPVGGVYTITLSAVADTQPSGTITFDAAGASPLIGSNLLVASNTSVVAGMFVNGIGFDSNQTVVSTSTLSAGGLVVTISAPPDSTPTGPVVFTSSASSAVFAASTTVTSVNTFTNTITINNATTGSIAAGRAIQSSRPAGYYIRFTTAVPATKPVTVLIGFDQ